MPFSGCFSPYASNIDPGTSEGSKLYRNAIAEDRPDDKRIKIVSSDAPSIISQFQHDSSHFAWGRGIHRVPIAFEFKLGTFKVTAEGDILKDYKKVDIKHVRLDASRVWGDYNNKPTSVDELPEWIKFKFPAKNKITDTTDDDINFERVRRKMIGDYLFNVISKDFIVNLRIRRGEYEWHSSDGTIMNDGPTVLKIIIDSVQPSTKRLNINLQLAIESARLNRYDNDPVKMLNAMKRAQTEIIANGGEYGDLLLRTFQALLDPETSKNTELTNMVQRHYDDYEMDRSDVTFETLAADVGVKFNNIKSRPTSNGSNEWDASMKSVSQKMQIMALTTKVKQLEAEKSNNANSNSTGKKPSVEDWRKKYNGDTVTHGGKSYSWCKHHKLVGPNGFDGLYMRDPHDHDEWQRQKDERNKNRQRKGNDANDSSTADADDSKTVTFEHSSDDSRKELQLKQSLKKALLTRRALTPEVINKLIADSSK